MDTKRLQGDVRRGVTVYTDDPAHPKTFVAIRALVLGSVVILPRQQVTLTNNRPGLTSPRLLVRQEPTESGALEIRDLQTSVPWISARATRIEQERPSGEGGLPPAVPGDWLIEIEVDGAATWGHSQETLQFRTGLSRQPLVEVPIIVNLLPPLTLSTEELTLSAPADGGPAEGRVTLTLRRGLDPTALTLDVEPDSLDATLERVGGRRYEVLVRWNGAAAADGALVFRVGPHEQRLPVVRQPGS